MCCFEARFAFACEQLVVEDPGHDAAVPVAEEAEAAQVV